MKVRLWILVIDCMVLIACNNPNGSVYGTYGYYDTDDAEYEVQDERIRLTGVIETCNKCRGYGMVQDGMYGQPEICKFCWVSTMMRIEQGWTGFDGRYGLVDAVFNRLPADYFDDLDWNTGGGNGGDSGIDIDQIEQEIAQHEENIASIEHQLEYIEGGVNRAYLEQQLIEEQYEVRRLKMMLNNL